MKTLASLLLLALACGSDASVVTDSGAPDAAPLDASTLDTSAPEAGPACVSGTIDYVAKYEVDPQYLALDATNVYWEAATDGTLNGGTIFRIGKRDWGTPNGSPIAMGSPGNNQTAAFIAVDDKYAYWAGRGSPTSIWRTDLATNAVGQMFQYLAGVSYLASDATSLYWPTGAAIVKGAKVGGAMTTLTTTTVQPVFGEPILVDATSVYFVTETGNTTEVDSVAITGGSPTTLAPGTFQMGLALRGGKLYWKDCDTSTTCRVFTVATSGGTPAPLATDGDWQSQLAVDDTNVYWINGQANNVNRVPINGGSSSVIAQAAQPLSIAIDDTFVYWAEIGTGAIKRYCK